MTKNLDQLRQAAERATPGPWAVYDRGIGYEVHNANGYELNGGMRETFTEADATHIATFDPSTVLGLIDRAEAAEQALDFHTQRDRELKTLLSMIADRLDEFCYDELASLIEDEPLNQWSEKYTSKLQAAERERDEWRGKYDEAESARAVADAAVTRVREVAHYSNKAHREAILEALDGGEQE